MQFKGQFSFLTPEEFIKQSTGNSSRRETGHARCNRRYPK